MNRQRVFDLLDGERKYQITRWEALLARIGAEGRVHDCDKVPADWILYMEQHLDQAKKAVYNLNLSTAMGEIRKVTALGVAAMENIDTPSREDV